MLAKLSEVRLQLMAVYKDPVQGNVYRSVNENIPLAQRGVAPRLRVRRSAAGARVDHADCMAEW